jgi:hypothetical protein
MAKTRIIGLFAAAICFGLVAAGPSWADGLARFEKSIKPQIPPDTFTYKSSKALGDDGFELDDVVITPPASGTDKPTPISIKSLVVEHLDFDAIDKQQPPLFAKVKLTGVSGTSAAGFDLKQMAGIDTLTADFVVDYKLDPDKKTFTLNQLTLNLNSLAKLDTAAVFDGVSADAATKPDTAMNDATLKSATMTYDDHSLLAKAIPIAAAMQGGDPKTLIAMATGMLDAARAGQGPAAQKAIDSLVAFIEDYEKPKGPLKVALNPPGKVTGADISNAKSADDMVKLLGVEVSYAGTRKSTPAAAPDTGAPPPDEDKKKE